MPSLRADCASCFGLCCVASAFSRSADFALDKPVGRPCPNLLADFRCGIHDELRPAGFPGCTVFDCQGAGQQVAQVTYGGRDWREAPQTAAEMFEVFGVMRQLHEILWYLTEASVRAPAADVTSMLARVTRLTDEDAGTLVAVDVAALRDEVRPLLARASAQVRGAGGENRSGADLVGAKLRGSRMRRADLRGAYLIAADLRGSDLRCADLLGTDLRGARLEGARLDDVLFLTQFQLNAARGNATTTFPDALTRPTHW